MDHSKKSTYLFSIDALRVIAILAVIAIHISIKILAALDHQIDIAITAFLFNQTTRFAVPLFFLISGFVLELNYKKLSYISFFKKRASRVIIPFFFWSFMYIFFSEGLNIFGRLDFKLLSYILDGKASYHLYFIPTLIIFYLLFPMLHKLKKFLLNPFVFVPIITLEAYFLYIDYYIKTINLNPNHRIALLSFVVFYLGIVASSYKDKILNFVKVHFKIILILYVLLFFLMPFHVYQLSTTKNTTRYIYSQYHILNYIYTLIFGALFFYILEKTQFAKNFFITLSKLSFFVFFIHVLVQTVVWENIVVKLIQSFGSGILGSFWFTPFIFVFLSFLSFGIAFLVHKVKGLAKITG